MSEPTTEALGIPVAAMSEPMTEDALPDWDTSALALVIEWRRFSDRFMDADYRNDPKRLHIRDAFAAGWDAALLQVEARTDALDEPCFSCNSTREQHDWHPDGSHEFLGSRAILAERQP